MRIYDNGNDSSISNIVLYFTISEAKELRSALNTVIERPFNSHAHVSSADHQKEITVCIYNTENLGNFDQRSKKLILEDK